MRIYIRGAEVLRQYWKTVDSGSLITNVREIALDSLYKAGAEEREYYLRERWLEISWKAANFQQPETNWLHRTHVEKENPHPYQEL